MNGLKIFPITNLSLIYTSISILLYTLGIVYFWNFTIDDAYISLRYAENLSQGYGLVFNIVDEPYEAYSNFFFVLLESLLLLFGLEGVLYVKLLSYFFGIATILLLPVLGNIELSKNKYASHQIGFTQILLGTSSPYIIWTVGGLETIQFTFVVMATFVSYSYAESIKQKNNFYYIGDFFAVIAMLSRPEGLLVIILAITYRLFNQQYKSTFILVFTILVYHLWKYWYFGDLLASPYYAKVHEKDLLGGLSRVYGLIELNLNIVYIFALLGFFGVVYQALKKKALSVRIYMILFVLGYTSYVISLGYQVTMDDAYRYYVPSIAIFLVGLIYFFKYIDLRPVY